MFLRHSAVIPNNKGLQAKGTIETSHSRLSLRFGHESTNLDSITAPFREVYLTDTPIGKIPLNLRKQRSSILKVRESADLNPQHSHPFGTSVIADNSKFDLVGPVTDHPKRLCTGQRKVQNSSPGKRASIINPDRNMATRGQRVNHCDGPQRQRPMSSRQFVHVVPLPISRLVPMKTRAIPRSHPPLYKSNRIPGEAVDRMRSCGAAIMKNGAQSDHDEE